MTCYHPLKGFKDDVTGAFTLKQWGPKGENRPLSVPCGQCVGCRLERSRQWAVRCMHEASLHDDNCFITLTYDNEHLRDDRSLFYPHFQGFMKRLRARCGVKVRFYMCGEYGEQFGRPHYHALIFGFDFPDKYKWAVRNGSQSFRSPLLEELWPYGNSEIGTVNFKSSAYVARYIMKKITGKAADEHYFNPDNGTFREPEFNRMSLKPGIAAGWFEKFSSDVFPNDYVVVNGRKCRPPRYYDVLYSRIDPLEFEQMKFDRELQAEKYIDDNTVDRLLVKEKIAYDKLSRLPRSLDD